MTLVIYILLLLFLFMFFFFFFFVILNLQELKEENIVRCVFWNFTLKYVQQTEIAFIAFC